jgi:predicted nuclease with RNAse H fold
MTPAFSLLGIDLGGCMGGTSAYVYANVTENGITVTDAFKEPRHKNHEACLEFLVNACGRHEVDAIAIDAPLGIPAALTDPAAPQLPRKGNGEILNPYLYRYTDYYLYHAFGLRPMPPAGDRIGRLTARTAALLHRLKYRFPHLTVGGRKVPIFEVYPRQIAQHLGLEGYKKEPSKLFERLNVTLDPCDEHLLDALLCVYAGSRILQGRTVQPPPGVENEGWCYVVI